MAEQDQNSPPPAPPADRAKLKHQQPDVAAKASPLAHAKAIGAHRTREVRKGELAVTSLNGQAVDMGVFSWQHAAAAALHGWGGHGLSAGHEHEEGKPIELSLDDYKKALLAASAVVVRAAVDVDAKLLIKRDKEEPRTVVIIVSKGEVIDLRKLNVTTEELANGGVSFTADYEPHAPALSKHSAHFKKTEAAKRREAKPDPEDDSHLFAKA